MVDALWMRTLTSDFGRFMISQVENGTTTADHLQPEMEVMFSESLQQTNACWI